MRRIDKKTIRTKVQKSREGPPSQKDISARRRRHPLTLENSPQETMERMRGLPERAEKLREIIRALREENAR